MAMNARLLRPLATGLNPKSLGTLALWLDGADRSRMFSDDAATTLSADDGQVAVYKEKANGYNLSQTTANNRPLVRANIQNGRSVLEFDGSNDLLASPALADDWPAVTAFTLFWRDATSVNPHLWLRSYMVSFLASTAPATSNSFLIAPNGSGWGTGNGAIASSTWHRLTNQWKGGTNAATDSLSRVDGVQVGSGAGTSNATGLANQIVYIGNRSAGDRTFDGYIAEMLIYSQSLSAAAIAKVENYLKTKWGL
jgi:hypothetical protein